jgi:type IV pilus assembly protein PilY1
MFKKISFIIVIAGLLCTFGQPFFGPNAAVAAGNEDNNDYTMTPPFLTAAAPPLVMLVMGRSHKLYYEAYNDASDLDGDGDLDVGYKPDEIDYYGYFDSYKCYTYQNSRFEPTSLSVSNVAGTNDKACSGGSEWSGDLLNYLTMTRMDAMRKVLYGGYRSTDTATETVLQRAYVPQDAHSWGKEYKDVSTDGYDITEYSPLALPNAGTRHLFASTTLSDNGTPILRLLTNETHRIWTWVSKESPVAGDALEDGTSVSPTDYTARVLVCDLSAGLESNCKIYPGTDGKFGVGQDSYKPIGMLQRYGETEQMLFGLISGSYAKNTAGGVLRKTISLISDEIDSQTGEFEYQDDSSVNGIIKTIDNIRIFNYVYAEESYKPHWPGAWVTDRAMIAGEFTDWGNPTAEMMYEALRYFSGAGSATPAYTYSGSTDDSSLDLPLASWDDPYSASDRWCSQPFMLVISDINPSYDADQLPGSVFADETSTKWPEVTLGADASTLNVEKELDDISIEEGISGNYYIGDKGGTYDSSCAPKALTTLKDVRGLCPEEPTKGGGYYAASVAHFGHEEDMSSATNDQKVLTYTVGLASALPKIEISLGNPAKTITLVPFAKSVGGCLGIDPSNSFTPTNTIVDFYVESITPISGQFRINYEDVEQAADHDMDAIARYSYIVLKADGITPAATPEEGAMVRIIVDGGVYASGCIIQHLGYIISGSTKDGTYLEVRDADTPAAMDEPTGDTGDVDYFLDTPPGEDPGGTWDDNTILPTAASRLFTPGATAGAELLPNPLWYAAKWGSFLDHNFNGKPDLTAEWDENEDGSPDNYFYVQNPLMLERNLNRAFLAILERATAGTSASVLAASRSGEGATYQSIFYPKYKNVSWVGDVHALLVDAYGQIREDTNANLALDNAADKIIEFDAFSPGVVNKYTDTNGDGELSASEKSAQSPPDESLDTIKYLWSAKDWLNSMSDAEATTQKATYGSTAKNRFIFTFIDADGDMVADGKKPADGGEVFAFSTTAGNRDAVKPYLHLFEPFTSPPGGFNENSAAAAQIDYIRGKDQSGMRNRQYDSDGDSVRDKTHRLGDIISSTATLVGTPAENYDLLYADGSYREFWIKYRDRRKVVYVGGNDGMLHAFNAGFFFFDSADARWEFGKQSDGGSETAYDLGAELWGYIPMNLLPHLYWLTDPNYQHVFYVDQKPKIFDAKIFADDSKHPNGWGTILVCGMRFGGGKIRTDKDHDGIYENGDQIMKSAYFVLDITDPESAPELLAEISFDDLGFTTSYPGAILVYPQDPLDKEADLNKENKWYLVLGSGPNGARLKYTSKNQNFTAGQLMVGETSGTRATFVDIDLTDKFVIASDVVGWFENGERIYHDANSDGNYDSSTDPTINVDLINSVSDLKHGQSSQKARIHIIDLVELAAGNLKDPDGTGLTTSSTAYIGSSGFDDNTQIADFITVDLDLDYATDAMYFGTIADTDTGLGGKLRRIVMSDPENSILPTAPGSWDGDSTLIDMGQPVTTAPSVAMDWKKRTWVFFGTGRFTSYEDVADADQQSYYGIKEPWQDTSGHENNMVDINKDADGDSDLDNEMTWEEVYSTYLLDVSNTIVFESGNIKNYDGVTFTTVTDLNGSNMDTFLALEAEMDKDPSPSDNDPVGANIYPNGWKLNFSASRERNLGQAALLGDILTFTTYAPDPNACQNEGDSYLYATYYKTGTAFSRSVIGLGNETDPGDGSSKDVLRKQSLGKGLAVSPAMHTGREEGTKAFIQTSTGAILVIEQANPGAVKSGRTYWMED